MFMSLVEEFVADRQIAGCTPKTLAWHRNSLHRFHLFLLKEQVADDQSVWDTALIRRYILHLQNDDLAPSSIATYTRSLFAFTQWIHDEGFTSENIQGRVKRPRMPQIQKPPFTDLEVNKLLSACNSGQYLLRDVALLSLMFDCGLRATEVSRLETGRVSLHQSMLSVTGKGQVDRYVPFSLKTGLAMRRYINRERPDVDSKHLFVTRQGIPFSPNTLLQMVNRLGKRSGVNDVHPHRFRHTFAISYLRNGGDPLTLQRMLGHTTLTMTNRYVNMVADDLQAKHLTASP